MKSRITWVSDKTFTGQTESGHSVVLGTGVGDAPKPGPSAMELVLMGAGGCAAWDIVEFLSADGQDVDDVIIELDADRADTPPKVFTRIHLTFVIKGRDVSEPLVSDAIERSLTKYCSGMAMMGATAKVTHEYRIISNG